MYDNTLATKLIEFIENQSPTVIHTYLPMDSEVDFYKAIQYLLDRNLKVVCPRVEPKPVFKNLILTSLDALEQGRYDTRHPAQAEEYEGGYDLIIVPGLAYNSDKYRLGYGGGYYDYFLNQHRKAIKLGLFYSFQLAEYLPVEVHDVPLDFIINCDP